MFNPLLHSQPDTLSTLSSRANLFQLQIFRVWLGKYKAVFSLLTVKLRNAVHK